MKKPKRNHFQAACRAGTLLRTVDIGARASSTCYFLVLAAFPALVLILNLLSFTPLGPVELMDLIRGFLPEALVPYAERIVNSTYQNTSGAMVSLSALVALWSASKGVHGLLRGFNAIYGVAEDRGYFYTRAISVVYTFLFLIVLLLTLVLHVFGTTILSLLPEPDNPVTEFLGGILDLRFFLLLILQTALFTAMYMAMPNRHNSFFSSLPGAVLASLGWLIFSDLFSVYVEHFPRYTVIYGSVYAVALSMLWLFCCISILFYGGLLNRFLMESKGKKEPSENNGSG